jgi:glycosyltransferase involved in cell wall biosynthesis
MRILHLNTHWKQGGAAIACERLHRELLQRGVDSNVLCENFVDHDARVGAMFPGTVSLGRRILKRFVWEVKKRQRDPTVHCISLNLCPNGLVGKIRAMKPDIVHLHWVGFEFLRIEDLPRIPAPKVWTLHDMWPFCGAEHIVLQGERWKDGYTRANRPREAEGLDLNRWVWERKMKSWPGSIIHTISVSSWIERSVRHSRLFQEVNGHHRVIPNGLDVSVFRPPDRPRPELSGRRAWRLVFGADRHVAPIKGVDLLLQALRDLRAAGHTIELITFGGDIVEESSLPVENLGRIESPEELADVYGHADLVIVPSRLESFGQAASEALACGTPVVCFDTSGLRDIVHHRGNGYRARCYDPMDLARGVLWCLEDPERHRALSRSARETVLTHFEIGDVADKTLAFYEEIIEAKRQGDAAGTLGMRAGGKH